MERRTTHNIYMIDGGEQNDRGCGGCFMNLPSQDAIAQFQTLDSNYQPDYGIGSGGTILMVLKSGTSRYHGELYEFNRNTAYNANDYFLKQGGKPRSTFQLNVPGGNIGGPLWIPHVYNESENSDVLLLERRVATAYSGQLAFGHQCDPRPEFPDSRCKPRVYASEREGSRLFRSSVIQQKLLFTPLTV